MVLSNISNTVEESLSYFKKRPKLAEKLDAVFFFGYQVLLDAIPSDWDSLKKIGYFPFGEASDEINYAVSFSLAGLYKTSFWSLRNFLELCLTGIYFLSLEKEGEGVNWLKSKRKTPSHNQIIELVFKEPYFEAADKKFDYKSLMKKTYDDLCKYIHTRGEKFGYKELNRSNLPRFNAETLENFVIKANDVSEVIAIALVLKYPILLISLPIFDKFGLNPPMSGFLDYEGVEAIERIIDSEKLKLLKEITYNDDNSKSIIEWIESLPDISKEELEKQIEWHKQFLEEMKSKPKKI